MGKKKANIASDEESGEMDMSPMIDMVFLLLIFFVVNATAHTRIFVYFQVHFRIFSRKMFPS